MNIFNEKEFLEICRNFNMEPVTKDVTVRCKTESYFNKIKTALNNDRRGEVVFCVIRPSGRIVTVTSNEYPEGTFRIPTGGIGHTEDIIEAVARETMEELGLKVEIISFLGALKIKFEFSDDSVMFYSYLFILRETGGRILEDASDDEVSEIKEVDLDGLKLIADKLDNMEEEKWESWGKFRFETTSAILSYLQKNPCLLESK